VINYEFNYFSTYLFMKDLDEYYEIFEMLMVVTAMKVAVVWDTIPCNLAAVYWCCRGSCCCILLTDAAGSTEMCVLFYQNTWHHITEDGSLQRMNILLLLLHMCVWFVLTLTFPTSRYWWFALFSVCREWLVKEDGALAYRLQTEESK